MSQDIRNEAQRLKPGILNTQDDQCYICGFRCRPILVVHHIIPVSLGGDNDDRNIVALCPNCHAIVHKYMSYVPKFEDGTISIELSPDEMPDELRAIHYWGIDLSVEQYRKMHALAYMKPLELKEDNDDWSF